MTTVETRIPSKSKRTASANSRRAGKSRSSEKPIKRTAPTTVQTNGGFEPRVTKHDRLLALLSRSEGATIANMMQATGWQQHSVRGFLAGTVKKKLGLNLTSEKEDGGPRCYRIVKKRGR